MAGMRPKRAVALQSTSAIASAHFQRVESSSAAAWSFFMASWMSSAGSLQPDPVLVLVGEEVAQHRAFRGLVIGDADEARHGRAGRNPLLGQHTLHLPGRGPVALPHDLLPHGALAVVVGGDRERLQRLQVDPPVEGAGVGVPHRLLDPARQLALGPGEVHGLVHGLVPRLLLGGDVHLGLACVGIAAAAGARVHDLAGAGGIVARRRVGRAVHVPAVIARTVLPLSVAVSGRAGRLIVIGAAVGRVGWVVGRIVIAIAGRVWPMRRSVCA